MLNAEGGNGDERREGGGNYELRVTNYELRITNYELRITSYELRITNYEPQRGPGAALGAKSECPRWTQDFLMDGDGCRPMEW